GALDSAREFVANESAPAIALGGVERIRPVARAVAEQQLRVARIIECERTQFGRRRAAYRLATALVGWRRKPCVQHALGIRALGPGIATRCERAAHAFVQAVASTQRLEVACASIDIQRDACGI